MEPIDMRQYTGLLCTADVDAFEVRVMFVILDLVLAIDACNRYSILDRYRIPRTEEDVRTRCDVPFEYRLGQQVSS